MILYLSSKQFGNDEIFLRQWVQEHDHKILLIANAMDAKEREKIQKNIEEDTSLLEKIGFEVNLLDLKEFFGKPKELKKLCEKYFSFCVIGGNVFVLREAMKYSGFDTFLQEICHKDHYLYVGYSAGGCVLSKNLELYSIVDNPIDFYHKGEVLYDGLGMIDYVFIPHYQSNYHKVHLVDEAVEVCKNKKISYKALRDGDVVIEKIE